MSSSLPSLFWLPFLHQHLRVQSYTQVYHSSHKPHSALAFQHPSVKGGFWWSQSCLLVGHWYPYVASRCILLTVSLLERGWSSELPSWVIWCKKLPENVSWTTYCSKKSCFMCLIRSIEVLGSVKTLTKVHSPLWWSGSVLITDSCSSHLCPIAH